MVRRNAAFACASWRESHSVAALLQVLDELASEFGLRTLVPSFLCFLLPIFSASSLSFLLL